MTAAGEASVPLHRLQRASSQPENPFASLIPDQQIAIVPSFTLECGVTLYNVPIAYSTRGELSPEANNALVICHALSGSADVADWWGPLMGRKGKAFDVTRFFVVCLNSLGSPYGSASPVTAVDGDPRKERYGPDFPETSIRDDVNIHKIVLEDLGVKQIAAVVGGSMGGMLVLEYAYFGPSYIRTIVPIATSARHSGWGIAWGEQQRQCIGGDPKYADGYYSLEDPPTMGLGAARMAALLTYRSRNSFEARFGRNTPDPSKRNHIAPNHRASTPTKNQNSLPSNNDTPPTLSSDTNQARPSTPPQFTDPQFNGATIFNPPTPPPSQPHQKRTPPFYSAQSYLRYQGQKFTSRFDSNCYNAITLKLDTHDIARGRTTPPSQKGPPTDEQIAAALALIQQPALVIGIESDGLFTFGEQEEIARGISGGRLRRIESPEGHDAFLLQFEQVNRHIVEFFREVLADIMEAPGVEERVVWEGKDAVEEVKKSSTFGEAEVGDLTAW